MTIQPIRLFGDPVLRTPASEVVDFDKELRTLVDAGEDIHAGRSRFEPLEGVMLVAGQGPLFPHADEYLRDLEAFRAAAQVEESKDNIL